MIVRHSFKFMPAGMMLFGIILVKRDAYRDSLIAHELVHVRQLKENPILFYPRYLLSKKWRLRYELEAYAESIRFGENLYSCAALISSKLYGRMVSYEDSIILLKEKENQK